MSTRHRDDLVADLVSLCRECNSYVAETSLSDFLADRGRIRAVERTLELIGEVAHQLGSDVPNVDAPWEKVRRLRILLAHVDHKVDAAILYETARQSVPKLLETLDGA